MNPQPDTPPGESGPDAIRSKFAAVAAATDTPAPEPGKLPTTNLAVPISSLARSVGMICGAAPIFTFGEGIVTVDPERGTVEPMDPVRFMSWVERYLSFTRPGKESSSGKQSPVVESIGKDKAAAILRADDFRAYIRELKAVSEVRLPVWQGEGEARRVELAPEGYDAESGLFTVDTLPFRDDMSEDEAWSIIWDTLHQFPFEAEGQPSVKHRRSFAAQVGGMIGVFCHHLFPDGTARPMLVFNANQPGSGKSLLMRICLAPVHGPPDENGKSENEAELEKVLDAAALARRPYLALDDLSSLRSHALNRFLTSPRHGCRVMHSQRMTSISKACQVLVTGNGLLLTEDLDRRALVIDLFEPGEAATRKFSKEITTGWLFSRDTRARLLAALWAFVRRWRDQGHPMMREHRRGSFEEWSGLVGGIVLSCGLANPFTPRATDTAGGNEAGRALKLVIGRIVGECPDVETPPVLNTSVILERAEADDLLETIVGASSKDPRKALGWKLKPLKERVFLDSQGRAFEFGKRTLAAGSGYPIRFV